MYTNCDCLTQTKLIELTHYVQSNSPDVIALTEILPKNSLFDVTPEIYALEGYSLFTSNLNQGRGVLLYIKESLATSSVQMRFDFQECIWCNLALNTRDKLMIGCIYRSPHCTADNIFKLFQMFRHVCAQKPSHLLILGDFNFKEINWHSFSSSVNETQPASEFLECIRDCYLFLHVKQPTRFRADQEPSTLDLIFTNEEHMINNISYLPGLGKSDHLVLIFKFFCYTEQQISSFTKLNYFKGNYEEMSLGLGTMDWVSLLYGLDLSDSWDTFAENIIKLVEANVPVSKASREPVKSSPYVNNHCLLAIKHKHSKWTKYQHCKSDVNYAQYKIARNLVISELRKAKYDYEKDLAAKIKTNNKLFWGYVRSKLKTKSMIGQLEAPDGSLIDDSQAKANLLNNYFVSVFQTEGLGELPAFEDRQFASTLIDVTITEEKISKAIDRMKPSKSQEPDKIHPMIIKECKTVLLKPLKIIFEKSVMNVRSLESGSWVLLLPYLNPDLS